MGAQYSSFILVRNGEQSISTTAELARESVTHDFDSNVCYLYFALYDQIFGSNSFFPNWRVSSGVADMHWSPFFTGMKQLYDASMLP